MFFLSVEKKNGKLNFFADPTIPRSFNCKDRLDVVITLEWQAPEYPNGDLKQYKIEVYVNTVPLVLNKTEVTGTPVNEFDVTSLEPGTCTFYFIFYRLTHICLVDSSVLANGWCICLLRRYFIV